VSQYPPPPPSHLLDSKSLQPQKKTNNTDIEAKCDPPPILPTMAMPNLLSQINERRGSLKAPTLMPKVAKKETEKSIFESLQEKLATFRSFVESSDNKLAEENEDNEEEW
jgi:hypothetical protein